MLAKNVAFNILKKKMIADLMKTLSNMYEKPSASNKVYLMHHLFKLNMFESVPVADHINEFNLITSLLSSVNINFEDEIHTLILLSSLLESWGATMIVVNSSYGSSKLKFEEVQNLILGVDIKRRESKENSSYILIIQKTRERTI